MEHNAGAQTHCIDVDRAAIFSSIIHIDVLVIRLEEANGKMTVKPSRLPVQTAAACYHPTPGFWLL